MNPVKPASPELCRERDAALRPSRNFTQRILDTTANLSYIHDLPENRNSHSNPGMVQIPGYSPGKASAPITRHQEPVEDHHE